MTSTAPIILVVDDDATARILMRAALHKAGFEVVLAGGGGEALRRFAEKRCDMVMLDVDMPDIGGLDAQDGADLMATELGHVDVEHDEVERLGAELAQGVAAAFGQPHIEAGLAQGGAHDQARVGVVVDDQDRAAATGHTASASRSCSCSRARFCSRRVAGSRPRASSMRPSRPQASSSR